MRTLSATKITIASRLGRLLSGALTAVALVATFGLAVGMPGDAHAQQPMTRKVATNAQASPGGGLPTIEVGRVIIWEIQIPASPFGAAGTYIDTPQGEYFVGMDPGTNECVDGRGSTRETDPPQPLLLLQDLDMDGSCKEAVTFTNPPIPASSIFCDPVTQRLEVRDVVLGAFEAGTIRFQTLLDPGTTPGSIVCNWGHLVNPSGGAIGNTAPPGGMVPSCTCIQTLAPSGFDATLTKTAIPETTPLIPGDPAAIIGYTITLTNTGTQDIAAGSISDNLAAGQEWVDVPVCPPGLTCTITTPTRLSITGINLAAADPDLSVTIEARTRVTCGAATDDDTGRVCNQANFNIMGAMVPSDDPSTVALGDATCTPVVWSDLTSQTTKIYDSFTDNDMDGNLSAGDDVRFEIRVSNRGRLDARNVVVTDDFNGSACWDAGSVVAEDGGAVAGGVATWNVGTLAGSPLFAQATVHARVRLTADMICCNQATVQSDERIGCGQAPLPTDDPGTPADDDTTCASPGPQPIITVTKSWCESPTPAGGCPGTATVGTPVAWTITITNSAAATGTATNVQYFDNFNSWPCNRGFDGSVTITPPAGGTNNSVPFSPAPPPPNLGQVIVDGVGGPDGLAPGESVTLTYMTAPGFLSNCCNQGEVTYDQRSTPVVTDDPATPGRPLDDTCLGPPATGPDGELQKTGQAVDVNMDGFLGIGDQVIYTIIFTNVGGVPLNNVVVTDPSSACITFDTSSVTIEPPAGGTNVSAGSNVTVNVTSPMAVADSVTITVTANITAIGNCCNQATATSPTLNGPIISDEDPTNLAADEPTCHTAVDVPAPDCALNIQKVSSAAGCVDPGTPVTFTVTVTNTGGDPVTTWGFTDVLPAGLTNIVADPPLTLAGNTVTASGLGTLASMASRVFTYHANAGCTASGSATSPADATYDCGAGGLTDSSSAGVTWGVPNLTTSTKIAAYNDADGSGHVDIGELVTYTITVLNTGACNARNVVVTDTLIAQYDPATVAFTVNPGGQAGNVLTWDAALVPALASVAPGPPGVILEFTVLVDAATPEDVRLDNSVTIDPTGSSVALCAGLPSLVHSEPADRTLQWGAPGAGGFDLLRNGRVSCLTDAITTINIEPVLPLDPVADLYLANPTTPVTIVGDATVIAPVCPQAGAGDGNILIFYALNEAMAPFSVIRLAKSGADVVISW